MSMHASLEGRVSTLELQIRVLEERCPDNLDEVLREVVNTLGSGATALVSLNEYVKSLDKHFTEGQQQLSGRLDEQSKRLDVIAGLMKELMEGGRT